MADLNVYWQQRATRTGKREVFTERNPGDRFGPADHFQSEGVISVIGPMLTGNEKRALDYGCGKGRFTPHLASLIGGSALGVDPSLPLINEATSMPGVRFFHTPDGRVPTTNRSMDLVYVSLVLGGLRGALVRRAVSEITRVIKPDGLLVLVENTVNEPDAEHWVSRSVEQYQRMFPGIALEHQQDYDEDGERLSIMAGRVQPVTS